MPVATQILYGAIYGQMNAMRLTGRDSSKLANAIASSVAKYLIIPNLVTCSLTGATGPIGTINSVAVVGLVPKVMSSLMVSKAYSKNLKGRDISKLFDAISNGIGQVLQGMVLSGTAVGIAVGGGTGFFTAVSDSALSKMMLSFMKLKKIEGRDISKICDCISFGITNHLKTSVKFTLVVSGAIAPTPPTGPIVVMGVSSIFTKIA